MNARTAQRPSTAADGKGMSIQERVHPSSLTMPEGIDDDSWYRSVVELSPDAIFVIQDDQLVFTNQRGLDLLGAANVSQIANRSVGDFIAAKDAEESGERLAQMESGMPVAHERLGLVRLDGSKVAIESSGCHILFEGRSAALVVARDISSRVEIEGQLAYQAHHDALTLLPNRDLFQRELNGALIKGKTGVAVLFCDLDRFKMINDSLGHAAGDRLLKAVATRLSEAIRQGDVIARFGGDEFTILCREVSTRQVAEDIADRLREALEVPFDLVDGRFHVSASIGIALSGPQSDPEDLLRDADAAMYRAKTEGPSRQVVSAPDAVVSARRRLQLESDLRRALAEHELRCHYQPVVDLSTGKTVGVEALARWFLPDGTVVPPGEFVPVAEGAAFDEQLDHEVLDITFGQLAKWQADGSVDDTFELAVNLSPRTMGPDLPAHLDRIAELHHISLASVIVEITERQLIDDIESLLSVIEGLVRRGVRIALDDFGVGNSSLAVLADLPVDRLKIDRSFMRHAGPHAQVRGARLLEGVVGLGQALGLGIVAEGIEDQDQLDAITALGCDLAQGYFLGRPAAPEAVVGNKPEHGVRHGAHL